MEATGELAQLFERESELFGGGHEERARCRRIGLELRQREPQRHRERDQALLRAVVQVSLEATPLDVAGRDDPRPRRGKVLEPGVELGVQAMDLRRLRLALGDVRVGDHVSNDLPDPSRTGAAAIDTATSVPSLR